MNFLLAQILRALLRIEKKQDNLLMQLHQLSVKSQVPSWGGQLNDQNQTCPLCHKAVGYQPVLVKVPEKPDVTMEVMLRTCGCEPRATQQPIEGDIL